MLGFCKIPDCNRPVENRDSGLCATHSKAMRQMVKTPIKKVADKLKAKLINYDEKKTAFLRGKRCAIYPNLPAQEIHHKAGRTGDMLLDESQWLAVSRKGHVYIEMHPKEAKEKGWSISRL